MKTTLQASWDALLRQKYKVISVFTRVKHLCLCLLSRGTLLFSWIATHCFLLKIQSWCESHCWLSAASRGQVNSRGTGLLRPGPSSFHAEPSLSVAPSDLRIVQSKGYLSNSIYLDSSAAVDLTDRALLGRLSLASCTVLSLFPPLLETTLSQSSFPLLCLNYWYFSGGFLSLFPFSQATQSFECLHLLSGCKYNLSCFHM